MNKFLFIISAWLCVVIVACKTNNSYVISLQDTYGLKEGDPVTMKGKTVGNVNSVDLHNNKIIVDIGVNKSHPVFLNAKAFVTEKDVLGNMHIEIVNYNNGTVNKGDTIPGMYLKGNSLNNIAQKADSLLMSIKDSLLIRK